MKTGGDLDHTVFLYEGGGAPHDVVWSESFVEQLSNVYLGTLDKSYLYEVRDLAKKKEAARAWCLENTWEHRGRAWRQVIEILSGEL